ncbi:uncharacterized protein BYT42DRAFT_503880 [Radiomyces spectabilis]|uniref:uncharacterized protein n=1 Tax=Radiomyces spectabilis TaxID=64574 RepID=UPI00221EA838|nr:uncharacterized protein BYT42DRAFT_503880 [Radiomyces spectabilis]KAI8368108.1 hypothetical protein BYT42DRAFT_503880 [Radiomyces spectabilis]
MSLTIFWQDLVRFLNESEFAVSHGFQVKRDPGIISVPLEDCHPPSMAWMDYLKLMWEMTGQKWWHKAAPGPSIWRGDYPAVDGENVMTLVRMAHVEPSTWKAVIQRCKSADISPHAALLAALVLAWGQVWPGYDLETSTPVNARKFCEPAVPANCMGNYTGVYESTWSADQCTQPFWSFAETYHTNLQANKANGVKKSGLLGFLTNYPQDYCQFWYDKRKQNEFGRTGGVELSDLGRVTMNTKTTERWHVDKLWFCQSAQTYTTALGVNSVTLDGHLYLTLCWHKGAVDPTKVDRFLQLMVNQLEQVASATTTSE